MYDFDPDFASPAQWARMYRSFGLQVVPAPYPMRDKNDKRPALGGWREFQGELVSEERFAGWFPDACRPNMGVITGNVSGRLLVIDLDDYKGGQSGEWWHSITMGIEPETPCQITGGGGRQYLFRVPEGFQISTHRTPIADIRCEGGFAMLPPSRHMNGKEYAWARHRALWECEIAEASAELCQAVIELIESHRGTQGAAATQRTENPATDFDNFGNRIDGREEYMRDVVWAAVLNLHRRTAGVIDEDIAKEAFEQALEVYLRGVRTRIPHVDNIEGLESEGRGPSAFLAKWQATMRSWTGKVATEAAKESPRPFDTSVGEPVQQSGGNSGASVEPVAPRGIRTFDFATLFLEDVVEEPDYLEPNLLGPGGFLLIGGPPKAQKSWLLQDMLISAAVGVPFLGDTFKVPRPLRVFWLQAEMNEKLLRRRAKAVTGLTPEMINDLAANLIVSDRFRMILNPEGVEVAAKLIRESFGGELPDIIAFDPMANIFDQENENDNAQVMKFLTQRIEAVRQFVNPMAGVILVHHATKKGPDEIRKDPFNCFRGGGALRGHYDSGVIIFRKDDIGDEREVHFEFRGGDTPDPMTVRLEGGQMKKVAPALHSKDPKKGWPDTDTCQRVIDDIRRAWDAGDPWSSFTITEKTGRYAPALIQNRFGIKPAVGEDMIKQWLMNDVLTVEEVDSHTKKKGLKVIGRISG